MTRRRKKQELEKPLTDRICGQVRSIAIKPFVLEIKDDFAGYFDSLCIYITVGDTATNSDIQTFKDEFSQYLSTVTPKADFTWQIVFHNTSGETIDTLFPCDFNLI